MKAMTKPLSAAIATIAYINLLFWAGGINFDKRGEPMFWLVLLSGVIGALVFWMVKAESKPRI